MGRPRDAASVSDTADSRIGADDRIREASAMTLLLPTSGDVPALGEVRGRAHALYARSHPRVLAPGEGAHGQRVDLGTPPSRGELDDLWSLVPASHLAWARKRVASAVSHARAAGMTATPQAIDLDG